MPQYEIEMTIEFPNAQNAGKFAKEFEEETGYPTERNGSIVKFFLYRHGDEVVMRNKAEKLGGKVTVEILKDID